MNKRILMLLSGATLAGTLALTSAGGVGAVGATGPSGKGVCAAQAVAARTSPSIDSLRAFGDCEIARRLTTLGNLSTRVSNSKVLTSSDRSSLTTEIASTVSGLNALKTSIDAGTTIPALRTDIGKIATQFRVYLLVVPQVHLVNAADGVLASQARFTRVNTNLSARIASAKAAGKNTAAAQASLDAMNDHVAKAISLATGLPAKLLPLTPAEYNAGSAGPVLKAARTALVEARGDLKAAIADAAACRAALKTLGF